MVAQTEEIESRKMTHQDRIPEIKNRLPLPNLIESYGIELEKTGNSLVGLCPFHNDQNHPNLSVTPSKNLWNCTAGCGGGDQITFVERIENISRSEAIKKLAEKVGLSYPSVKGLTPLQSSSEGLNLETLANAKSLPLPHLKNLGCGDIVRNKTPVVRIPYLNEHGEEVAVRFRVSLNGDLRFLWRRGTRPQLYGLQKLKEIRAGGWVLLVEGESDCWTAWHYGLPALGLPGKTTWRAEWARHLDSLEVFLWQEPGAEDLTRRITPDLPELRVIRALRSHKDISAIHLDGQDVFELIKNLRLRALPAEELFAENEAGNIEEIKERAVEVLGSKDPICLLARAIRGMGYGGSIKTPLLVCLAVTSRVLAMRAGSMPVHVLLIGQTSAGKNYAVSMALNLLPEEAYTLISAGSPRTLIYGDADLRHRVLVFGEADSLPSSEDNPAASAIRNLLQDHRLHYDVTVKDPETGNFVVRKVRKEGPTVLITTAIRRLGPQLDSRLFSLDVPDDQDQIRSALKAQAFIELEGAKNPSGGLIAYQELLQAMAPFDVIVPFADRLSNAIGKSPCAARILRDFARLLSLIKAVAVLRHRHRRRDKNGRLVAEAADYRFVYGLVRDVYAASVTGASTKVREVVGTVAKLKSEGHERITITELAKQLNISKQAASGRAWAALRSGWLINREKRKKYPFDLDIGEELPPDEGLPKPSLLEERKPVTKAIKRNNPANQDCQPVKALTDGYKDPSLCSNCGRRPSFVFGDALYCNPLGDGKVCKKCWNELEQQRLEQLPVQEEF